MRGICWKNVNRSTAYEHPVKAEFLGVEGNEMEKLWNEFLKQAATKIDAEYGPLFDVLMDAGGAGCGRLFADIVDRHPDAFDLMGRPKLLAHQMGYAAEPLSAHEYAMELSWEVGGVARPDPARAERDGRLKRIVEPATGQEWSCVEVLAGDLGCARGTVYNHLGKPSRYPSVAGRVFEYVDSRPLPGSIDAMTDAERADLRARMISKGWTPRF